MEEQQVTDAHLKQRQSKEATHSEAKNHEDKLMSTRIAMFMALVAILGAVTAYRAARAEQDTLKYERRLQQGQMLELVHRQELLSLASSRTRYENSAKTHQDLANSSEGEARKLAAVDRRQAAAKKLQAEEELAHVRSLAPYLNYFDVGVPPNSDLEAPIAEQTADWLRNLGFDTVWDVPAAKDSLPDIWQKLKGDVSQGQTRVIRLAKAVVLFVLALALLTFAQLNSNRPRWETGLWWIGGLLAGAGLVFAVWADRNSWKDFLAFSVGFGVLAVFGAPLAEKFHFAANPEGEPTSSRAEAAGLAQPIEDERGEDGEDEPVHPAEVDPALFAGMRLHFAPVAHKFGRFVICMIAVSAVLSALSGFFYSRAAVASSKAISDALDNQAELFRMNSLLTTMWNKTVGRMATAEDYHLRYEAARQSLQLATEDPALLNKKDATDQLNRRRETLENFEQKEPEAHKLMTGDLGPEQDMHFPRKLVITQSYHDPAKEVARWSANNEMSLGYQREATAFLSLLTLFAIALYLLGQALGMGRTSAAFILVLFACGLVAVGVLRGLFVEFEGKPIELRKASAECRIPGIADDNLIELAAEHFAAGWVLYQGSADDREASKQAAREFGCAAEIRPTFAVAKLYFARATNGANTPQLNEGAYVSMISKDSLGTVSQAESQAIGLLKEQGFAPPADLVGDYGFDTYAYGLVKRDWKPVTTGEQGTKDAIALRPDDPMAYFNRGLAEMAERREQEALETYRQTIAMGEQGKPFVSNDVAMIGGAITDLEVLKRYCRGLNDEAYCNKFEKANLPKLKSEMVAAAWPAAKGRTRANSGIQLTGLKLWGSSGGLGWSGNVENLPQDPAAKTQDSLVILWYARDKEWDAWRVLPAISERVTPAFYGLGFAKVFYSVLRASDARICLQRGDYRAEFYVDGELADTTEPITLKHEKVKPGAFPDLNIALCYPSEWQPWKSQDPDAVWTRGYIQNDHNRGAFVFSFFDPQEDGEQASKEHGLRRAENILQKEGLTAGPGEPTRLYECAGMAGSSRELMTAFSGRASTSLAKAWTTDEGFVNVVVVVDKNPPGSGSDKPSAAQSPARQDCEILLSATTIAR